MKRYRVRLIPFGKAGAEEREIDCADDGTALIESNALLADFHAVETWDGDRLVCRVIRAGAAKNGAGPQKRLPSVDEESWRAKP